MIGDLICALIWYVMLYVIWYTWMGRSTGSAFLSLYCRKIGWNPFLPEIMMEIIICSEKATWSKFPSTIICFLLIFVKSYTTMNICHIVIHKIKFNVKMGKMSVKKSILVKGCSKFQWKFKRFESIEAVLVNFGGYCSTQEPPKRGQKAFSRHSGAFSAIGEGYTYVMCPQLCSW